MEVHGTFSRTAAVPKELVTHDVLVYSEYTELLKSSKVRIYTIVFYAIHRVTVLYNSKNNM